MTDNIKAAAERLMELSRLPIGQQKAHVREWPELGWDGIVVARAWLAEHPADSDEPITAEWLRSVGMSPFRGEPESSGLEISNGMTQISRGYRCQWLVNGCELDEAAWPNTRGDFRRLAAALGIDLTEAGK